VVRSRPLFILNRLEPITLRGNRSAQSRRAALIRELAAKQRELHEADLLIAKAKKIIDRSKPVTTAVEHHL